MDWCLLREPNLTSELEQVNMFPQILTDANLYSAQSAGSHPGKSSDKF